ncbi:mucin-associated surface protein (MASP) [Trypanosoma cruzi]|nr:mucin-associated surface protein (MASP) [Trypanosoma cruzi]
MCPHIVDGRAHSAAGWAGGHQSAARWSARICGAHVGKRSRRRQRRAVLLSKKGTAPPTQRVPCDTKGTRRHVEEWAGIAPCLCAEPPLVARCPGCARNRVLATPTGACHAVCAPSFSSWASFHYNLFTAVRQSTCQALTQSCERNRAIVACLSAASLRGIPQCDGENMKPTEGPRCIKESSIIQLSSVT